MIAESAEALMSDDNGRFDPRPECHGGPAVLKLANKWSDNLPNHRVIDSSFLLSPLESSSGIRRMSGNSARQLGASEGER
jgi:hypothetical protein